MLDFYSVSKRLNTFPCSSQNVFEDPEALKRGCMHNVSGEGQGVSTVCGFSGTLSFITVSVLQVDLHGFIHFRKLYVIP